MALSATSIVEVQNGGSDTLNGGLFNPGATFTADGAATVANTSAPVFTSASYTFVAGDVGAKLFIKSGTNWTPGWYTIASVSAGAATLTASVGSAVLYTVGLPTGLNTIVGCATVASPTGASWGVDYSQQSSNQYALTGLTTSASNAIILTSSASVNMIGNGLIIKAGTNFTTGYYQINSVSAGVSITVDRTCTTAAGSVGTAGIGGAMATIGKSSTLMTVAGQICFVKYNAAAYSLSTKTTATAGGCVVLVSNVIWCGYDTNRYTFNTDANRPTMQVAAAVTACVIFTGNNVAALVMNFILDGNSQTTSVGMVNGGAGIGWNIKFMNFASGGWIPNITTAFSKAYFCEFTGNATVSTVTSCYFCESHGNTSSGFFSIECVGCISYGNTGASSDGFINCQTCINCVAYNNGRIGFNSTTTAQPYCFVNCISEGNTTYGYSCTLSAPFTLVNCADYNNTSGRSTMTTSFCRDIGPITGASGSFFTSAASSIFTINSNVNAGALLRGTGFPAAFPAGLTTDYTDVGASQHRDNNYFIGTPFPGGVW